MTAALAAQMLITLLQQAATLAPLIQTAIAEKRDLTPAELDTIFGADAAAKIKFQADLDAGT